ncbi:MAG: PAS domain S-box protein [Calditrichaeota bacterium]|nr:PAS domain S-box protein [Calditrichota bacterium]MCB9391046.1 PAS domain S-box protein [Calditrichota bacterium]
MFNATDKAIELSSAIREAAGEVIFVVSSNGTILDANTRGLTEFGITQQALGTVSCDALLSEEDKSVAKRTRESILSTKRGVLSLQTFRTASGSQMILEVSQTPVLDRGEAVGLLCVGRDVTDEAMIDDKLWENQDNREAALEYSVRASLGLIKGYVYSLRKAEALSQSQRERYASVIVEEVETLSRNVENLLFSRNLPCDPGNQDLCDVRKISTQVIGTIGGEASRREIEIEVPDGAEVLLFANPEAILRIISNLIDYFMLRIVHSGTIRMNIQDSGEYVELTLTGTGGLPTEEELEQIANDQAGVINPDGQTIGGKVDIFVARLLCEALGGGLTARTDEQGQLELAVMLPRQAGQAGQGGSL